MDNVFMNVKKKNSKTDPHRLILNLRSKSCQITNLKSIDRYVVL